MNRKEYDKRAKELWDKMLGITEESVESLDCDVIEEVVVEQLILKLSGLEDPFEEE